MTVRGHCTCLGSSYMCAKNIQTRGFGQFSFFCHWLLIWQVRIYIPTWFLRRSGTVNDVPRAAACCGIANTDTRTCGTVLYYINHGQEMLPINEVLYVLQCLMYVNLSMNASIDYWEDRSVQWGNSRSIAICATRRWVPAYIGTQLGLRTATQQPRKRPLLGRVTVIQIK